MRRVISYKDLPGALRDLADKYPKAAKAGLISAAKRSAALLSQRSIQEHVFNIGTYARGWKGDPHPLGARIHNDAPYAGVIEEGRRPGARYPPPQAIQAWVRRKLGSQIQVAGKDKEAAIRSIAFLVSRKIVEKGIPAKHILEGAMPQIEKFVLEEVSRELRAAAEEVAR